MRDHIQWSYLMLFVEHHRIRAVERRNILLHNAMPWFSAIVFKRWYVEQLWPLHSQNRDGSFGTTLVLSPELNWHCMRSLYRRYLGYFCQSFFTGSHLQDWFVISNNLCYLASVVNINILLVDSRQDIDAELNFSLCLNILICIFSYSFMKNNYSSFILCVPFCIYTYWLQHVCLFLYNFNRLLFCKIAGLAQWHKFRRRKFNSREKHLKDAGVYQGPLIKKKTFCKL